MTSVEGFGDKVSFNAPDAPGTDGWHLVSGAAPGERVVSKTKDDGFDETDRPQCSSTDARAAAALMAATHTTRVRCGGQERVNWTSDERSTRRGASPKDHSATRDTSRAATAGACGPCSGTG